MSASRAGRPSSPTGQPSSRTWAIVLGQLGRLPLAVVLIGSGVSVAPPMTTTGGRLPNDTCDGGRRRGLRTPVAPVDPAAHQALKERIDPFDDAGHRPVVGGELERGGCEPITDGQEQLDVPLGGTGRWTASDRPQRNNRPGSKVKIHPGFGAGAGRRHCDADGQFNLDRVGVLELVDQQVPVLLAEPRTDIGSGAQEVTGPDEQGRGTRAFLAPPVRRRSDG